jgi:hypothetical protein
MLSTTCHCGAIHIEIPRRPQQLTNCNCSICRRIGALWAYYKVSEVRVTGYPENTAEYVWGDKTLRIVRCRDCGCVTHWEPLQPKADSRMGVNARNFDAVMLGSSVRIRCLDGASTWKFID